MADDERRAEIEADREHEAVALAIQAAMPNTPGQLANVAIAALDRVRDARGDDETSDAVRGDLHGTPGEWPERQPTDPDRGQLRDAATPASGRGRPSVQGEIEAVAAALNAWWNDGQDCPPDQLDEQMAEVAIDTLDRVRDARGDDEAAGAAAQHREDTSKLVAAGVRITELENEVEQLRARLQRWEAGLAATEKLQLAAREQDQAVSIDAAEAEAARSQGEDHEGEGLNDERRAEVEAVARELAHAYGHQDFPEHYHRKIAGQILDRVRDARGDDELRSPETLGLPTKRECGVTTQDWGEPLGRGRPTFGTGAGAATFTFDGLDLDVLCESLWHSLQRADVPSEDIDAMRRLRERLNHAR